MKRLLAASLVFLVPFTFSPAWAQAQQQPQRADTTARPMSPGMQVSMMQQMPMMQMMRGMHGMHQQMMRTITMMDMTQMMRSMHGDGMGGGMMQGMQGMPMMRGGMMQQGGRQQHMLRRQQSRRNR